MLGWVLRLWAREIRRGERGADGRKAVVARRMRWGQVGSAVLIGGLATWGAMRMMRNAETRVMRSVQVYVMLQLNAIEVDMSVLESQLRAVKEAGVVGVMVDFWWSRVEERPGVYNWSEYERIVALAAKLGLKLQCVMSFHTCGEVDGDDFVVKLPAWVIEASKSRPGVLYQDEHGNKSDEYVSLGADLERILPRGRPGSNRTPIEAYTDFMRDFRNYFKSHFGTTIVEIQVGLGPSGELRYPGYALSKWKFPGIGAFQCYDEFMLGDFERFMRARGKNSDVPPIKGVCGSYNSHPQDTEFFRDAGLFSSEDGKLFQEWYFGKLIEHGDRVLAAARSVFGPEITLSAKVSGVHWWYHTASRAAEATAGYYRSNGFDCYGRIAAMLKKHNSVLLFTCMEKLDKNEAPEGMCSPQSLIRETARAASLNGVKYGGENAVAFRKWSGYMQIIKSALQCQTLYPDLNYETLTVLRMDDAFVSDKNLQKLSNFVHRMKATD